MYDSHSYHAFLLILNDPSDGLDHHDYKYYAILSHPKLPYQQIVDVPWASVLYYKPGHAEPFNP